MRAAAAFAAAALLLAGCGGSSQKQAPALSGPQARDLQARVAQIRQAVDAGDLATTQSRLRGLQREVARLQASGALDVATAQALRTGTARAAARAAAELPPVAPATSPGQAKKDKQRSKGSSHGEGSQGGDGGGGGGGD